MTILRPRISFDVDGVIASGAFQPEELRTNAEYFKKPPVSKEIGPALGFLSQFYDIFILSARSHPEANMGLRAWFHYKLKIGLETIAGILTPAEGADVNKSEIVRAMSIQVHFDDDPRWVESMPGFGVLIPADCGWEPSHAARGRLPTLPDWPSVLGFLTTPGVIVYGSNGTSVVSPAPSGLHLPVPQQAGVELVH